MQDYNTIIGIIEFRQKGLSFEITEKRFNVGSWVAQNIISRFSAFGISLDDLKKMDPKAVVELFYPQDRIRRKQVPMPDFQRWHDRIHAPGSKANITFCWLDYKQENPDGYQLTQFTEHYNRFLKEHYGDGDVTMAVERVPGEKMYIDWVGDEPKLLVDPVTGELKKACIFATTMGFSSLVFAECFADEKLDKFITGVTDAVSFYGGISRYFVPDNLRTAITKHSKDTLLLNSLFSDLENFYDTVVLPPPARKPRGKATVEEHVSYLETHLIEKLKEDVYTSVDEINRKAKEIVEAINRRTFKRAASRLELFEKYDKPSLKPLSKMRFSPCDYKVVSSIPDNYHIEYDGHYYSVSYTLHGKPAILKASFHEIVICDEYNRLLCRHKRAYADFPKYITVDEHMPKEHLFYKTVNTRDGDYFRSWAKKFGPAMATFIDLVLRSADHEPQAFNSCMGILQMSESKPYTLVDEAASLCLKSNQIYYSGFKRALGRVLSDNNLDEIPEEPRACQRHKNIRGKESYR